jgi:inosine-uridine nucleoside N-ribohydrolase
MKRQKLILDVDTGTDDAVAIMLAAQHPAFELLAVTTVNGNAPVAMTTDNSLRVLEHIGAEVPVYCGMHRPLARPDFPVPRALLPDRSGSSLNLPAPKSRPQNEHAVDYLINTVLASAGDVALVATAPLTNIAMALSREPKVAQSLQQLIIMGGTHAVGNITPAADFNVWADPEAARLVCHSGISRLTLIPLDCTHQALISREQCRQLRALSTKAALAAASFIEERIEAYGDRSDMRGLDATPLHDALAVAALAEPSLIATSPLHVDVETRGEITIGRTVIDVHHRSGQTPNVAVAMQADADGFFRYIAAALGSP